MSCFCTVTEYADFVNRFLMETMMETLRSLTNFPTPSQQDILD